MTGVLKAAVAMRKLPGGDDVQWIYIVDESAFVANGDTVFANENEFGVRDFKLLPVRCAYCKWTETRNGSIAHNRPIPFSDRVTSQW